MAAPSSLLPFTETPEEEKTRFLVELEFVQALSTPAYLQHLAMSQVLSDPAFVRYLSYLQYWTRPEYARHLLYPSCLYFLKLLQLQEFRDKLLHEPQYIFEIARQRELHWRFYRLKQLQPEQTNQ